MTVETLLVKRRLARGGAHSFQGLALQSRLEVLTKERNLSANTIIVKTKILIGYVGNISDFTVLVNGEIIFAKGWFGRPALTNGKCL